MVFNSLEFLVGFLILVVLYFFCKQSFRKILLVIANTIFYLYLGHEAFIFLLLCIVISYLITRYKKDKLIYYAIIFLVLFLAGTKYCTSFFVSHNILIPLGISFFTFKLISYMADVKSGKIEEIPSFVDYYIYISFFAQVTAGPISRCDHFVKEINNLNRVISYDELKSGFVLFCFGMFEKIIIATRLAIIANTVFDNIANYYGAYVILGVLAYGFQLYTDFDAYSNIAIGLAKMLGISTQKNFNVPYLAFNLSDFWRRWHISLSSWFKDYVYIPLGGNRKNHYLNIMIVSMLSGIWHGNTINFFVWGLLHGVAQFIGGIYHKYVSKKLNITNKFIKIITIPFSIIITFVTVNFLWIFFRCNDFSQSLEVIKHIFYFDHMNIDYTLLNLTQFDWKMTLVLVYMVIVSDVFRYFTKGIDSFNKLPFFIRWSVYFVVVMLFIVLYQYSGEYDVSSFIYGNF